MLTTSRLCELIPDVSPSTIYRRVGQLADAGILEVVDEQRVRGAVERSYRLRRDRATIDAASATTDDHRRVFAVAMATLIAEFNAYLTATPPTRRPTPWATASTPSGSRRRSATS